MASLRRFTIRSNIATHGLLWAILIVTGRLL